MFSHHCHLPCWPQGVLGVVVPKTEWGVVGGQANEVLPSLNQKLAVLGANWLELVMSLHHILLQLPMPGATLDFNIRPWGNDQGIKTPAVLSKEVLKSRDNFVKQVGKDNK